MTDVEQLDHVAVAESQHETSVVSTTQTVADPGRGMRVQRVTTQFFAGRVAGSEIVWLIAGVVLSLLAMDFIFHAAGANNVGFAAFVFAFGAFFAAPFAGIFTTSYATPHNSLVWADLLAMIIYALLAVVVAKVVTIMAERRDLQSLS